MNRLDFDELSALADRRDHLCANVPACPDCTSIQVQIMNGNPPARWRCRICNHWFTHEPAQPQKA